MKQFKSKLIVLAIALATIAIFFAPSGAAEAGANGQQLTIRSNTSANGKPLPGFVELTVSGNNNANRRVTWAWRGGEAYDVTTTNWWWKGNVTVQAKYANGAGKTCAINVPTIQASNFVIVNCSSDVPKSAPAPASNARWGNGTSTSATLWWNDNAGAINSELGFKIERRDTGAWKQVAVTPANQTSYNITGINGKINNCFRVRAYNQFGEAAYSNETCGVPCDAVCQFLNTSVQLTNGRSVLAKDLPGIIPVQGLTSTWGKPGQFPLNAPLTSNPGLRNPDIYRAVIAQFGVDNNARYARDTYTYCNTFAGDVMRAMGVALPTKEEYLGKRGDPATISAPDLYKWFTTRSGERGWREVNPSTPAGLTTLLAHVNAGRPAIASDAGHIAVIRPGQSPSRANELRIAQAGAQNRFDMSISESGYGSAFRPRFYIHD